MRSTPKLAAMAAFSLCGLTTATYAAQPQTFTVDCAVGQTISAALDKGDERKPMVLIVKGTCNESVVITRDDVTLQGDVTKGVVINGPSGQPTVAVRGASRVTLDRLTVRGGTQGIRLTGGSNVEVTNSDIQYAATQGISIAGTSMVFVVNCNVQNNTLTGITVTQGNVQISNSQITNNAGDGVRAFRGSSVSLNGGSVSTNAYAGVNVQSSEMTITGSTIAGNGTNASLPVNVRSGVSGGVASSISINNTTVRENAGAGVGVAGGGYLNVVSSTVTGNNGDGVFLYLGAIGNILGNTTISGNGTGTDLSLMLNATVQLGDGNLTIPNIWVSKASILWVNPEFGPQINAAVGCADGESSVNFSPRFTGPVFCSGF